MLLRDIRQDRGLEVSLLAERSGVDEDTIHQIELGRWHPSSDKVSTLQYSILTGEAVRTLERLAAALGVSVEDITIPPTLNLGDIIVDPETGLLPPEVINANQQTLRVAVPDPETSEPVPMFFSGMTEEDQERLREHWNEQQNKIREVWERIQAEGGRSYTLQRSPEGYQVVVVDHPQP